jgi:hypothetical protein
VATAKIAKKAMMEALHPNTPCPTCSWPICWGGTSDTKKIWSTNSSIPAKRDWLGLLMLAHFGKEGISQIVIPKISEETLAEMIGTTRSRVSVFMNMVQKNGLR